MEIVLASGNSGKLLELGALLAPVGIQLTSQSLLGITSVPETGKTFIENAIIKARHAATNSGLPAIADDSVLCVNALSGAPGIHSARYAGDSASDEDNNRKLIMQLHNSEDRAARFVCVLVFLKSALDPFPIIATGQWQGRIVDQGQGQNGFGYDPHFYLDELNCTSAQLSPPHKNTISHRGQASDELLRHLQAQLAR